MNHWQHLPVISASHSVFVDMAVEGAVTAWTTCAAWIQKSLDNPLLGALGVVTLDIATKKKE